ncbi:MAG: hypothetical protein NVSMB3_05710 [Acidobacteriaceae bacterium]
MPVAQGEERGFGEDEHTFVVAVVQAASVVFDRQKTLQKVDALARDAAAQGAKIV